MKNMMGVFTYTNYLKMIQEKEHLENRLALADDPIKAIEESTEANTTEIVLKSSFDNGDFSLRETSLDE